MPTPTKGPRLGGGPAHERLILANLATSLFEHDQITTTEAKAKRLRPLAERLVTFAKRGDLHARRRVLTVVRDKGVVHRLFTEIAPDMAERPGGYTRITKIGSRKGDNAPMAVIELVREPLSARKATVAEAEAATKRSAKDKKPTKVSAAKQAPEPEESTEADVDTTEFEVAVADADATDVAVTDADVTDVAVTDADVTDVVADSAEAEAIVAQDPDDATDDTSNTKA